MSFDAFWSIGKKDISITKAHFIQSYHSDNSEPAGEHEVYVAYCGEERESWQYIERDSFINEFGTLEKAIEIGAKVCEDCLKIKGLTEQVKSK